MRSIGKHWASDLKQKYVVRLVDLILNTVFFFRMLSASERDNKDEMRTLGREVRWAVGGGW
jgi:hypothetical protein